MAPEYRLSRNKGLVLPNLTSGMKLHRSLHSPSIWRPQAKLAASINSLDQLVQFNDTGGIAVYIDVVCKAKPNVSVLGYQSEAFSIWETRSASGFITKPKFSAELLTFRFVTNGRIEYLLREGKIAAAKTFAVLTDFDNLREVHAPCEVGTLSATISVKTLLNAQQALTGDEHICLPSMAKVADLSNPGMHALLCTLNLLKDRLKSLEISDDLTLPLLQEIMAYQFLSAWPKSSSLSLPRSADLTSPQLRSAIDFIEAHLSSPLTLADIAAAAGTSVRSLQCKFKAELNQTPVKFIIDRRLARAHNELISDTERSASITEIARRWGFVFMSDFGKRYKLRYGRTPSQTRNSNV